MKKGIQKMRKGKKKKKNKIKNYANSSRKFSNEVKQVFVDVTSEGIYPDVLRCNGCFKNHFPYRKFCKLTLSRQNKLKEKKKEKFPNKNFKKILRMRGGARTIEEVMLPLVAKALESARKHGIALTQGTLNAADGNCSFDAVINNINDRACFLDKLDLPSYVYRQVWITELEMETVNFPNLGAGYTQEEKRENWNKLKQSGIYDVDFFGDLVIHAISKGCRKTILIFNTSTSASSPIYVVKPTYFGGFEDCDIPVILGYNQYHYESLHPLTEEDLEKTKALVEAYVSGNYQYTKKDIQFLISKPIDTNNGNCDSGINMVEKIDEDMGKQDSLENDKKLLAQIRQIKASQRNPEQKRLHSLLSTRISRANKSQEKKNAEQQRNKERMARIRESKSNEEKNAEKQCNTVGKARKRAAKSQEEKNTEKQGNRE